MPLIAQHFRDKSVSVKEDEQVDIVRGKGKGFILSLHRAPGVGKTTTTEGVAEVFKKPLFQITCGDLGSTASEVEKALDTNFTLASRRGCILLFDEADVFLAARSKDDFIRNGLVAVFLRAPDYYTGIHFKTVSDAYLEFMRYLKDIYGVSTDRKAADELVRVSENRKRTRRKATRPQTERSLNLPSCTPSMAPLFRCLVQGMHLWSTCPNSLHLHDTQPVSLVFID
ncbi:hypothetical protein K458DRAFT_466844 [Lentithecium fluviatile CBS 122367]|uniref:ATPase AAA-type core domain-containing protein n=1 Tax=Lentithecium fluviatile CBS 122367 TaxID=1168545 RepID=A0A6G1IGH4_9PLEO|nr:hypothetical protein K458DRAFT_466844 [Lentithecium fluviatile CBS 122367]